MIYAFHTCVTRVGHTWSEGVRYFMERTRPDRTKFLHYSSERTGQIRCHVRCSTAFHCSGNSSNTFSLIPYSDYIIITLYITHSMAKKKNSLSVDCDMGAVFNWNVWQKHVRIILCWAVVARCHLSLPSHYVKIIVWIELRINQR